MKRQVDAVDLTRSAEVGILDEACWWCLREMEVEGCGGVDVSDDLIDDDFAE
jgi:hypothetical protein